MLARRILIALAILTCTAPSVVAANVANVIVLLADDLGYGDLGFQGGKDVATPHLDALARSGVRCTNAYVSCPVCSPTRAGLLTGRFQQRFGHEFNPAFVRFGGAGQGLPVGEKTIADRLKGAGHATTLLGKWHLGEEERFHPLNRGFDESFAFLTGAHSYVVSDDPDMGPIFRGKKLVELAQEMSLSIKSVSTYRMRVLQKMGMQTNADLTGYALEYKLI